MPKEFINAEGNYVTQAFIDYARPLVGPLPGWPEVHVAVMHSAVTLAPAVGRLVAHELTTGRTAPELQGLRPLRDGSSGLAGGTAGA